MKIINERVRPLAMSLLLMAALGLSSCSTGTNDGDASVEKGGPKDKNPIEHNENAENQGQSSIDTSSMENMEKPYEKTSELGDRNGDARVDPPKSTEQ